MTAATPQPDVLSQAVRELLRLNPSSSYVELYVGKDGHKPALEKLEKLSGKDLFCQPVASLQDAACVGAALWLWHDWLDPAHRIVQAIETASGSFWHAIIHRREGDFGNSKYWYA